MAALSYSAQFRPHLSAPASSMWIALRCAITMGSTNPNLCPTKPVHPMDDHINNYHTQGHIGSLRTTRPVPLTSRLDPVAHTSAPCVLPVPRYQQVPTAITGYTAPLAQASHPTHVRILHHGHRARVTRTQPHNRRDTPPITPHARQDPMPWTSCTCDARTATQQTRHVTHHTPRTVGSHVMDTVHV